MLIKADRLLALRNQKQAQSLVRAVNHARKRLPTQLPFSSNTFCHRLWDRVFIDQHASVYTCCRHMPLPSFGNLNKSTLRSCWNSLSARAWRWSTARGGLPCFDHCHLLSREELAVQYDEAVHTAEVPYEQLRRVTMLFGELCNVACTMCDQDHLSKVSLSLDLLQRQVEWDSIDEVVLQGGEPLAMKECKSTYIYLTEQLGKKVNFMTNGLLINDEWAERLAKHASEVPISLNAVQQSTYEGIMVGAKWPRMLAAVERLRAAKERLGSPMRMRAHMTIVRENIREIPDFVPFAKQLGFDRVDYGCDNLVPSYLTKHPELFDDVKARLPAALATSGVEIDTKMLESLGLC
jgi:sulfatase maturation enzyme AslB (radical SAM superfamily)